MHGIDRHGKVSEVYMAKGKGEMDPFPAASGYSVADPPPPPKHATPTKADPGDADLPRMCSPLTRAAAGQTRYKVSCHGYVKPSKYVLAKVGDADGAKACYRTTTGLDSEEAGLPADHVRPQVLAFALAD